MSLAANLREVVILDSDEEEESSANSGNIFSENRVSATVDIKPGTPLDISLLVGSATPNLGELNGLVTNGGQKSLNGNSQHHGNRNALSKIHSNSGLTALSFVPSRAVQANTLTNILSKFSLPSTLISQQQIINEIEHQRKRSLYSNAHNPNNDAPPPKRLFSLNNNQVATTSSFAEKVSTSNLQKHSLHSHNNHYIEVFEARTKEACDQDDNFHGQFKCTYNGCCKRLRNNICFMFHLWGHVCRFKPHTEEDVTNLQIAQSLNSTHESFVRDDEVRLRTCPECLLVQPNPHRMHLHYHRAHKKNAILVSPDLVACIICESVIRTNNLFNHKQKHGDYDAPYHCKKCKFRTSVRGALFKHFISKHLNSMLLLCPFCLLTFNVPVGDRAKPLITHKAYVQHLLDHDLERNHACAQCVTKITESSSGTLQEKVEKHRKMHESVNPQRAKIARKIFSQDIGREKSKPAFDIVKPTICVECNQVIDKPKSHFRTMKQCQMQNCLYESACPQAMELHKILSPCNPENEVRNTIQYIMECTVCSFETMNGRLMVEHCSGTCSGKARLKTIKKQQSLDSEDGAKQFKSINAEVNSNEEKLEIEYFGLRRMASFNEYEIQNELNSLFSSEQKEEDDEKTKCLKEFLATSKIQILKKNAGTIKTILNHENQSEELLNKSINLLQKCQTDNYGLDLLNEFMLENYEMDDDAVEEVVEEEE